MMTKNNMNGTAIRICDVESLGRGKYRIQFDNGVTGLLYGSEIRGMQLEPETYVSEEQYQQLIQDIIGKRAKKRALHLLERMDRSEQQLREKLLASEYPESCVEDAINYVKRFHYVDDTRYAENFIRCSKERMSRQQIKQKLMTKGISRDIVNKAVECEYDVEESEHIRRLLAKKYYNVDTCDDREFRRVYQYLLRRGFRSTDILREMKCKDLSE